MTAPLLSDTLGPQGRRRAAAASVLAVLALAVLTGLALARFADRGQLEAGLWARFADPGVPRFLLGGLANTIRLAAVSMGLALAAGLFLALGRLARSPVVRTMSAAWVELFRGIPVVLLILFSFLGLPRLGLDLSPFAAAALALTAYNSAVLGEIFRAGILSLDRGQGEAALAVGLTEGQAMRAVILPQAIRRMVPAVVSQLVTLLKDTSLAVVVTYEELLRRFQIAAKQKPPPSELQAFILAALVFVAVNLALSRLARRLEVRQRRRYRAGAISVTGVEDLTVLDAGSEPKPALPV